MRVRSQFQARRDGPLWNRLLRRAPSGRIAEASSPPAIDAPGLAEEIAAAIEGEVRFDSGSRAIYSTDASNYRQVPIGVVIPKQVEDVVKTVALCRKHRAPLLPRGGGTSLAGETANTAVVVDFSKYLNRVVEIDPGRRLARVEPGCILDSLRARAAKFDLTFGPDPATHDHNTIGGMIGNNSGGVHALMNGITAFNVERMEVLTYDGLRLGVGPTDDDELRSIQLSGGRRAEIYRRLDALRQNYGDLIRERFPKIPRRVSGYSNLDQLLPENGFNVARALVGTEGTCVTVLEATVNLIARPRERALAIIGFPDICEAADAVPRVLEHYPIGVEGFDRRLVERYKIKRMHLKDLTILPDGDGWLIVEFGAHSKEEAGERAAALVRMFEGRAGVDPKTVCDEHEQERFWIVRDDSLGAESYLPNHPDTWPGWEDSAVHPEKLGDYLRDLQALFGRYGFHPSIYGHFGGGVVHCAIGFELYNEAGLSKWRDFLKEAAALVHRHGGSLSGEHGDGQARAELLQTMYGPELVEGFREFKAIWDPAGAMNPGKVIDPYPITSNLRLGPEYVPPELVTHFGFREEGGFERAAQRCVGVGKCRRIDSGDEVMCPSFLVTREERHSTRGRARLLFEMLRGDPIVDGWRSAEVEEALELCLACKGCKSDCPVNVDMATYKSEFRSHHYRWRLRHRSAYSMGLVYWWARMGSRAPRLANAMMQNAVAGRLAKAVGGIAPRRTIPPFATETFTDWFRKRDRPATGGPRVLLWPDTFNNYFRPQTAIAATRVLEAAGFRVAIPPQPLCCGRPLYDWGWLDRAKTLWRQTMHALRDDIAAQTPIIGLEPACIAAFKDELPNLFPDHRVAKQLSTQAKYFADFALECAGTLPSTLAGVSQHVLVQVHCHHHAVIKDLALRKLLAEMGINHQVIPSGCCGMAGAFGFAIDSYPVSVAAAERALLPIIRGASSDTLILADGFSCREQIEQGSDRVTFHTAELLAHRLPPSISS